MVGGFIVGGPPIGGPFGGIGGAVGPVVAAVRPAGPSVKVRRGDAGWTHGALRAGHQRRHTHPRHPSCGRFTPTRSGADLRRRRASATSGWSAVPSRRAQGASRLPSVAGHHRRGPSPGPGRSSRRDTCRGGRTHGGGPPGGPPGGPRGRIIIGGAAGSRPSRALPASSGAAQRPGRGSRLWGRGTCVGAMTVVGGDG